MTGRQNKKKHYVARWAHPGKPSLGNVSFDSVSDYHAKKMADRIAVQIGLPNTPRTITEKGRLVESLTTGRTPK